MRKLLRMRRWFGRRKQLPKTPRSSDVWLVSFPKSGNTWLRFLIANAVKIHFQVEFAVNWFTIQGIIPDIHRSRDLGEAGPFGVPMLPRLIKSHARYNPRYVRVIVLVRDPRAVMVSWHEYLREHGSIPRDTSLSQTLTDPGRGIAAWVEHTGSWLGRPAQGQSIKVFRYEDLLLDPCAELDRIMGTLGLVLSAAELEEAVRLASRDEMRRDEERYRSDYYLRESAGRFVGNDSRQANRLSARDREEIRRVAGDLMIQLGYE